MKKIDAHISEHTFDNDGDLDRDNGLRLMCKALSIPFITVDDVSGDRWDEVLEWSNSQSYDYFAFICQEAGIEPSENGELTREIAMQIELSKS